jgi:hypothetical protein
VSFFTVGTLGIGKDISDFVWGAPTNNETVARSLWRSAGWELLTDLVTAVNRSLTAMGVRSGRWFDRDSYEQQSAGPVSK